MHRLADDNEDNAPFQIDLGVQGKQLYRTEPLLVGDHLSKEFLVHSETLLGFFKVALALEESASRLL